MKSALLRGASLIALLTFSTTTFAQYAGVAKHREHERHIKQHLAQLDSMDFRVLTHRQWDNLKRSHASDVIVHWPDGRQTKGLSKHIEGLKAILVYAPDTRIQTHTAMFESGEWTCVMADMIGAFTNAMPSRDGKAIPPTGKRFKIKLCAVGHWNRKGVMDEEYLFWDNQNLMQQIGVKLSPAQ